jgi:hypothetical protein
MSDYLRVKFREKLQAFEAQSFVQSSDRVKIRKAIDPRRPGEGVEVLTDDGNGNVTMEFVSLELVSSITFAPVRGGTVVASALTGDAAPKVGK